MRYCGQPASRQLQVVQAGENESTDENWVAWAVSKWRIEPSCPSWIYADLQMFSARWVMFELQPSVTQQEQNTHQNVTDNLCDFTRIDSVLLSFNWSFLCVIHDFDVCDTVLHDYNCCWDLIEFDFFVLLVIAGKCIMLNRIFPDQLEQKMCV